MSVLYWGIVVVLVLFGTASLPSVGLPILLLGFTLAGLGPVRAQRLVFWPALMCVICAVLGFVLVVPWSCSTTSPASPTSGSAVSEGRTTCSNLIGLDYSGTEDYNPSHIPALLAGLVAAACGSVGTWMILQRIGGDPLH